MKQVKNGGNLITALHHLQTVRLRSWCWICNEEDSESLNWWLSFYLQWCEDRIWTSLLIRFVSIQAITFSNFPLLYLIFQSLSFVLRLLSLMEVLLSLKFSWDFFTYHKLKLFHLKNKHYIRKHAFWKWTTHLLTLIKIIFLYFKIYFPYFKIYFLYLKIYFL